MYYSNAFPSTYEELISYYPTFYRDVLEMRAILEAEGRLLDSQIESFNTVIDNCFIDTADEETITRLEKFLHITPNTDDLNGRRQTIKLYFTGFGKMSASKLKDFLFPFTQTESTITFKPADEAQNNLLKIVIPRGNTERFSALEVMKLLALRLPTHIWYGVDIQYEDDTHYYLGFSTVMLNESTVASQQEDFSAIDCLTDENTNVLTDEAGMLLII